MKRTDHKIGYFFHLQPGLQIQVGPESVIYHVYEIHFRVNQHNWGRAESDGPVSGKVSNYCRLLALFMFRCPYGLLFPPLFRTPFRLGPFHRLQRFLCKWKKEGMIPFDDGTFARLQGMELSGMGPRKGGVTPLHALETADYYNAHRGQHTIEHRFCHT